MSYIADSNIFDPVANSTHRALIIIPERFRMYQYDKCISLLTTHLNNIGMKYQIIIVHQNNYNLFNRACLFNIGYQYAVRNDIEFDYVIPHDLDMFLESAYNYGYTDNIVMLYGVLKNYIDIGKNVVRKYDNPYLGGITIINRDVYESVNGYSNKFEGWGAEDEDFVKNRIKPLGDPIYTRYGVFSSAPNPRKSSNVNFSSNHKHCFVIKPTDGISNLKYIQPDIYDGHYDDKFCKYTILHKHNDDIYQNILHIYTTFTCKNKTLMTIDQLYDAKRQYLKYVIAKSKTIAIAFIGESSYFKYMIINAISKYDIKVIVYDDYTTMPFDCNIVYHTLLDTCARLPHYNAIHICITSEPNTKSQYCPMDYYINTNAPNGIDNLTHNITNIIAEII